MKKTRSYKSRKSETQKKGRPAGRAARNVNRVMGEIKRTRKSKK